MAALALGIGVNLAIFSALDAVVLGTLPVPDPGQIYFAQRGLPRAGSSLLSYQIFDDLRREVAPVRWAAFTGADDMFAPRQGRPPRPVATQLVSGSYFATLEVHPWRGRLLSRTDDRPPDGRAVAVLSYRYWRKHYAASNKPALGRVMVLNGVPLTIIGVAPPGFYGLNQGRGPEVWVPLRLQARLRYSGSAAIDSDRGPYNTSLPWATQAGIWWLHVTARVPRAADVAAIGAMATAVEQRDMAPYLAHADAAARKRKSQERVWLIPGRKGLAYLSEEWAQPLVILLAMSGLVLLIACGDVALLLLARERIRRREWTVRLALGAGRGRMAAAELAGSLALAAAGTGFGLLLAIGSRGWLRMELHLPTALDARMTGFCVGAALVTGMLFGGVPALRAARVDLAPALKAGGGAMRARRGFGRWLVGGQVALSVVLLLGAALLTLSLARLMRLKPGFAAGQVVALAIAPRAAGYSDAALPGLSRRLRRQLAALPGADGATLAVNGMVVGSSENSSFSFAPATGQGYEAAEDFVAANFFRVLGIPVIRGRGIGASDGPDVAPVVVVNQAFVRSYLHGRNPLGVVVNDFSDATIVGVVGNARVFGPAESVPPMIYHPWEQRSVTGAEHLVPHFLAVRIRGDAAAAIPEIRRAVAVAAPNMPVSDLATLRQLLTRRLWNEQANVELSGAFALLALGLAALGLYGVVAYAAARREAEMGLRMALGARPGQIVRLMLGSVAGPVGWGAAARLTAGLIAAPVLRSQLHVLSPLDPVVVAAALGALFAVAFAAAVIPARRAAKIEPWQALRRE